VVDAHWRQTAIIADEKREVNREKPTITRQFRAGGKSIFESSVNSQNPGKIDSGSNSTVETEKGTRGCFCRPGNDLKPRGVVVASAMHHHARPRHAT
jgi:hypothetical protein